MTRDELAELVRRNNADTLFAARMRSALGLPKLRRERGRTRDRDAKARKYRGVRKCMEQRYGVNL